MVPISTNDDKTKSCEPRVDQSSMDARGQGIEKKNTCDKQNVPYGPLNKNQGNECMWFDSLEPKVEVSSITAKGWLAF